MNTDTTYLIGLLATAGGVTIFLRAFPFLFFSKGQSQPRWVLYLGRMVSPAAIAMLVVWSISQSIQNHQSSDLPSLFHGFPPLPGFAEIAAGLLVVLLQRWKRNPLLSIACGTILYMLLI